MTNNKKITPTGIEVISEDNAVLPTQSIAQEIQIVNKEADIDGFIEKRQAFIQKVSAICVEGKDYHVIQSKKSLAKGGAEKIASIFHWTAKFEKDTEALEMIGEIKGWIAFKCTLVNGQFVGEGRGAALLTKNGGDLNKTLKMAQKSAFIDAVLRASGLSDFFTQDLEDMPKEQVGQGFNHQKPTYNYQEKITPQQTELSENGKQWIKNFAECTDAVNFDRMTKQINVDHNNGHITEFDWQAIKKQNLETYTRLTKPAPVPVLSPAEKAKARAAEMRAERVLTPAEIVEQAKLI